MRKTRLSSETIKLLIQHFIADTSARNAAFCCGVNKDTAAKWYHRFRTIIVARPAERAPIFDGEIEVDESYFGGRRKGKRGGAADKTIVFGLYKRNGYVYAINVYNVRRSTILPIIEDKVKPDSIVCTDKLAN